MNVPDSVPILLTIEEGIAEIRLNNPPLNLVTEMMTRSLREAVDTVAERPDVRVVLLTASGERAFCAGSDMKEFPVLQPVALERKLFPEHDMLRRLATMPMPTIAVMEGPALGGGFELAICCDLRVGSSRCTVGFPEVGIGGLASIATQRLPRLIGLARAKEMILLRHVLNAEQAHQIGLLTAATPANEARTRALEMAHSIIESGPRAIRLAKQLLDLSYDVPIDAGLGRALDAAEQVFESDDLLEGAAAFFERRKPRFGGPPTRRGD